MIGFFVIVACAATLHVQGIEVDDARDAANALEPLAGSAAATLFVLLLVLLPFMRALGRDRELMGAHALGRAGRIATAVALAVIVASVLALGILAIA